MGSPVQEILPGRGDKKGTGDRIARLRRGVPPALLAATCYLLLDGLPKARPDLWFSLAAVTAGVSMLLYLVDRRHEFSIAFLFSLFLLLSGAVGASSIHWLRLSAFPSVVVMTSLYPMWVVIGAVALWAFLAPLSLLLARAGMTPVPPFFDPAAEGAFFLFLMVAAMLSAFIFGRLRRQRQQADSALAEIRDRAESIVMQTGMESLSSDEVTSHYFSSMLKTDEEIEHLLLALKKSVSADLVNLFVPAGDGFEVRCSTEDGRTIITGGGEVGLCLLKKEPRSAGQVEERKVDLGYVKKKGKTKAFMAFPVISGASAIGVLVADRWHGDPFNDDEQDAGRMFAGQLEKVLERERVYLQIKRDYFGLKVLREESSTLLSSLDAKVIVRTLCEGAKKIADPTVYFFSSEEEGFRLAYHADETADDSRLYDLRGTFIRMGAENKQPIYIADVSNYKIPILPFRSEDVASVAVIPLLYENRLLGIFVACSGKKDFLSTFHMDLLKVMCNQASTSLANAFLHRAIEKMATTDGLTGLFNHRVFQEKLTAELSRSGRSGKPVSLLLTDIDFFKKINDTYGHPVGDLVLKGVSAIIRDTVRTMDIPARYGGEEFAVVLPETEEEGALQIAERLRKTVGEKPFAADGKTFRITMSAGIAVLPGDARTKEELIEKADQALYHAKHNGRNQCVLRRKVP